MDFSSVTSSTIFLYFFLCCIMGYSSLHFGLSKRSEIVQVFSFGKCISFVYFG